MSVEHEKDVNNTEETENQTQEKVEDEKVNSVDSKTEGALHDNDAKDNEINELKDQNMRLQAEVQNLQRRNRLDREDAAKFRSQKLAESLIPALDNLERVLEIEVKTEEGENIQKGIDMVLTSFHSAFQEESIDVLDPKGEVFDPNVHEAVSMLEGNEDDAGKVAEVVAKGYVLNGRVLRAAQVVVYQ